MRICLAEKCEAPTNSSSRFFTAPYTHAAFGFSEVSHPATPAEERALIGNSAPEQPQGFVYLLRIKEPWGDLNSGSIYHGSGIEGHWFRATDAWHNFLEPILDKATSVVWGR